MTPCMRAALVLLLLSVPGVALADETDGGAEAADAGTLAVSQQPATAKQVGGGFEDAGVVDGGCSVGAGLPFGLLSLAMLLKARRKGLLPSRA